MNCEWYLNLVFKLNNPHSPLMVMQLTSLHSWHCGNLGAYWIIFYWLRKITFISAIQNNTVLGLGSRPWVKYSHSYTIVIEFVFPRSHWVRHLYLIYLSLKNKRAFTHTYVCNISIPQAKVKMKSLSLVCRFESSFFPFEFYVWQFIVTMMISYGDVLLYRIQHMWNAISY